MDFNKLLNTVKDTSKTYSDKAIKYSSEKLASSALTIRKSDEVQKIIDLSANTKFTNKETGIEKTYIKQSIIIFGDEKSDFFKEALYILPVLATKGFSSNVTVKIAVSDIKDFDYKTNGIEEFPTLAMYENKKLKKVIIGKENILKLVKNWNLDINKLIKEV